MSYVTSVKKLFSDDLRGLITHITGLQEGTSEYKKCEDTSWSIIVDRYYPSVNEHRVKSDLNEFVDKFKVHGFPQKARNLAMLIDAYTHLEYFKQNSGTEIQWGLIDLLIKLSFKPTSSLEDDAPLVLSTNNIKEEESFNWGAYLKEGNEKFQLPYDSDDSLSDWSEEEGEKEMLQDTTGGASANIPPLQLLPIPPPTSAYDLRLEALRKSQLAADWLEEYTQGMWWNNGVLREIPISNHPEANYCFMWEKKTNNEGNTKILTEFKVLRELIYVLGIPCSCYFIQEVSSDCYKALPNISTSTLSPDTFSNVIENFCRFLPHIKKLQRFCSEMDSADDAPAMFKAYGYGLQKLINKYSKKLIELEKIVDAQDRIFTMFHLSDAISPYLNQLEFLSNLHDEAVPSNWREIDVRTNGFRLLSTLYNELKHPKKWIVGDTDWPVRTLLILMLDAMYPFLLFLGQFMSGCSQENAINEFFLSSSGEIIVPLENIDSSEFWRPVLKTASAAVTSSSFLIELEKHPTFFEENHSPDVLYLKLREMILAEVHIPISGTVIASSDNNHLHSHLEVNELFDGSLWDHVFTVDSTTSTQLFHENYSDKLEDVLSDVDLSTSTANLILQNCLIAVIEENMEPKGFAAEILLVQLHLLEHLNALFTSVHITSALSTILINESFSFMKEKKIITHFISCLSNVLPQEYVQNFRLKFQEEMSQKDIAIFDFPDYIHLYYEVDSKLVCVISDEIIINYSLIFRLLLKIRLTLCALNRLALKRFEQNTKNILRLRRLCSLRMWLIHTISVINFYFSTYNNAAFQIEMKELCLNERNLCSIHAAHFEFVENWKYHCFLSEDHPCFENILELIAISARLNLYWNMEQDGQLADYHLDHIEETYLDCMKTLGSGLQLFEERLHDRDDTFSFLYDEIINSFPAPPDSLNLLQENNRPTNERTFQHH